MEWVATAPSTWSAIHCCEGFKKELGPGLLADMCKQLGIEKEDLHYRRVYATNEVCTEADLSDLESIRVELGPLLAAEAPAGKSWYKTGKADIPVFSETRDKTVAPLSHYSSVIANIKSNNQVLLYVKPDDVTHAKKLIGKVLGKE